MSPMATKAIKQTVLPLPEELLQIAGGEKEARQELVLSLLRRGKISRGKAAELLGVSMWEMLDLMYEAGIPATERGLGSPQKVEETLRRLGKLP